MGGVAAEMKTPHTARESGKAKAIKTPEEIDQKKKKKEKKERTKERKIEGCLDMVFDGDRLLRDVSGDKCEQ
jgi:hypothetical protein